MAKDVAFQLLPSNFLQTATNAATQLTAAALAAGIVSDLEEAELVFDSQRDRIFEALSESVKQDNEKLKADYEAAPNKSYAKKSEAKNDGPPGEQAFTWGKHVGKSIATVYTEDQSYIDWLINKDTQPARNGMRETAKAYVESLKAGV